MAARVFTGLVQTQGKLVHRGQRGSGYRLSIAHDFGPLSLGESIAVNGVCLTVAEDQPQRFEADASTETVARSTLGRLPIGRALHLERALRVGDRLGGHIVAGHVDAVTSLLGSKKQGESLELTFTTPRSLRVYIAEKGSIAIDGVSLTINRVAEDSFSLMVIPHSQRSSHLGLLRRGDEVNLEVDVLARYVVHATFVGPASELAPADHSAVELPEASLRQALSRAGIL